MSGTDVYRYVYVGVRVRECAWVFLTISARVCVCEYDVYVKSISVYFRAQWFQLCVPTVKI